MDKKSFLAVLFLSAMMLVATDANAQVTIGSTNPPSPFSLLDLDATEQQRALHNARLTTDQRNALVTPDSIPEVQELATGLLLYNIDTNCLEFWNGYKWVSLCLGNLLPPDNPNLPPAPFGFCLNGRTCFDVAQSHSDTNFASDFSSPASRTFTLIDSNLDVTGLRFYITKNDYGAVAHLRQVDNTVEVVFREDLNAAMTGNDGEFTLLAQFYTGGNHVQTSLTVKIRDAACCMVRSTLCQGWLTFMCYNLGAQDWSVNQQLTTPQTAPMSQDRRVRGDLFQWGRTADGHQIFNSGMTDWPISDYDSYGQPAGSYVGQFISIPTTSNPNPPPSFLPLNPQSDWRPLDEQIDTLWSNVHISNVTDLPPQKMINDPCPPGWRVPSILEWASIVNGGTSVSSLPFLDANVSGGATGLSGNTWERRIPAPAAQFTPGYQITPEDSDIPTLFLPTGGRRNAEGGMATDSWSNIGIYWSSTVVGTDARTLSFQSTSVTGEPMWSVRPSASNHRAAGGQVRCVAD